MGGAQALSGVTFPGWEVAGADAGTSQGDSLCPPAPLWLLAAPLCGRAGLQDAAGRPGMGSGQGRWMGAQRGKPALHFKFAEQAQGFRLEELEVS